MTWMRSGVVVGALLLAASCAETQRAPLSSARIEPLSEGELARFAARVEAARGARFPHAARGWRVPEAALRPLLERELDATASPAELARESELAATLGLVPAGLDLRAALLAFQTANAAGFYSPRADRLYVVAGAASAGAESGDALLVHELSHALQAQRSSLFGVLLGLRGDDDLLFALSALLEGEATFVELSDAAAESGQRRPTPAEFAARFPGPEAAAELPRVIAEASVAAYPLGYAFVDGLVARGGPAALDAAYLDPPLTSEQLLHPERSLDGRREPLAELARDPRLRGCRVRTTTCYGELSLRAWLEQLGASQAAAARAADGWHADRAWRFHCGARAASAWLIEQSDAREAGELAEQLRARVAGAPGSALSLAQAGARLLVSRELDEAERAALLALPAPREFPSLAAYLVAHPELARRARR